MTLDLENGYKPFYGLPRIMDFTSGRSPGAGFGPGHYQLKNPGKIYIEYVNGE